MRKTIHRSAPCDCGEIMAMNVDDEVWRCPSGHTARREEYDDISEDREGRLSIHILDDEGKYVNDVLRMAVTRAILQDVVENDRKFAACTEYRAVVGRDVVAGVEDDHLSVRFECRDAPFDEWRDGGSVRVPGYRKSA